MLDSGTKLSNSAMRIMHANRQQKTMIDLQVSHCIFMALLTIKPLNDWKINVLIFYTKLVLKSMILFIIFLSKCLFFLLMPSAVKML